MRLATFRRLLEPDGQEALRAAQALEPREVDFLAHFQGLSRRYDPELSRAALEVAILRRSAAAKLPFAAQLYLTREALEQASGWEVSTWRSGRFRPFELLADLGCSVGGDTLALAEVAPVIGMDIDPLRLAMARANLDALSLGGRAALLQADLLSPLPLPRGHPSLALFFDPARRAEGRRLHSVRRYQPPLEILRAWAAYSSAIGVKISPGVDLGELHGYDAEVEFISLHGELKEAVLWFGPLVSATRRATLLPGGHTLVASGELRLELSDPQTFIYEPDPSLLRAGLVAELGHQLGACQLDPDIAYLTAGQPVATPFARCWPIEAWFPFSLKRLRAYLRQHQVGQVTVKKRGSPLQPEQLIRDLRLSGDGKRTLFLTHLRGEPIVVVALSGEQG
jgi:hypothetical protein